MEGVESYIAQTVTENLDAYCEELGELVAIDTPSDDPAAVGRLLDLSSVAQRAGVLAGIMTRLGAAGRD